MLRNFSRFCLRFCLIIYLVVAFMLLLYYKYSKRETTNLQDKYCETYHNWAWIHAPRNGLVSRVNDFDGV